MAKSKKIQMPAGIRNKLMAAVSMLLVSTIMMVSTTYAWFTLSTAPEVTGITTSVGANGNLEMALLTSGKIGENDEVEIPDTFGDLSKISSAVGDSSSAAGKTALTANITWGNLVDLSDTSYGLDTINLMPARLNVANEKLVTANLLKTAVYGKDGRVDHLDANTYSTVKDANGWSFDSNKQTYGVRAIGANDNLTPQQSGLMQAKSAYTTNLNAAKSTMRTSMVTNGDNLANAVAALAMENNQALTNDQKTAIKQMVNDTLTALGQLDTAYVQVLAAAASTLDSTQYAAATGALKGKTSYAEAKEALEALTGTTVSEPGALTTAVEKLKSEKTAVQTAKAGIEAAGATDENYKTALKALVEPKNVLINGYKAGKSDDDGYIMNSAGEIAPDFMSKYAAAGGLMVEMPDGSGVFAYIGSVAGNYSANVTIAEFVYNSIKLYNVPATMQTTAAKDTSIDNALSAITANGTTTGATALSDTFGYALDFAFRTNAANSYLQLQTEAAQRVYTDSTSTQTQGNGSTMTFKSADTSFTGEKVKSLMKAIRVGFVDPSEGTIYGVAALGDINVAGEDYTGKLYLQNYTFDTDGKLTTNGNKTNTEDAEQDESKALMAMQQNTAQKMTVIVWLDGDSVDNGDVANAAQSITGKLNLQFSSSAELVPMKNTALKNLTESETSTTKALTGIEITEQPTKTTYNVGEKFSAEGMVVSAKYSDNSTATVTSYTCAPTEALTAENNTITVSYAEGGVTKTATVTISVS